MLSGRIIKDFPEHLRHFCVPNDAGMIELMNGRALFASGPSDASVSVVKKWMKDYGLFQGVSGEDLDNVSRAVLRVVPKVTWDVGLDRDDAVQKAYLEIYHALYDVKPRTWTSAVSKLLWCRFPNEIVIYDSFVERAICVLQWLDDAAVGSKYYLPAPVRVDSKNKVNNAADYYREYQGLIYSMFMKYRPILEELCLGHPCTRRCPYLIRLFDRFLWGLGNPGNQPPLDCRVCEYS
ncbi:hypothetical protein [Azospirillum sp. sgz302134]